MTATTTTPPAVLPPGPSTPGMFNLAAFFFARRRATRAAVRRYGDAFTVKIASFSGPVVVVADPELVKTVFTAKPSVLYAGENPLGRVLGPGSLFSMDEDRHLQERRMLLPPFHGDRMRAYDSLIEEEALRAFAFWPDDEPLSSIATFSKITLRVILRAVFGAEGPQLAQLETILPRITELGQRSVAMPILGRDLGRWSPGHELTKLRARYTKLVDQLIDQHLADPALDQRIDILAMILQTLRESEDGIDRTAVSEELLTLLVAGHETTASSLAWAVDRLTRHPDLLQRLQAEAAGEDSTLRAATILEVQRTRPVISGPARHVVQPFTLGPWTLPVGTVILIAGNTIHDDDRYHDPASRFDPDRYIRRKPDTYSWVPFGGGVRRCIGAAFALREMDVVLRTMLREFELLPTTAPAEAERFRGVAHAPSKGGQVTVKRRSTRLTVTLQHAGRPAEEPRPDHTSGCPIQH